MLNTFIQQTVCSCHNNITALKENSISTYNMTFMYSQIAGYSKCCNKQYFVIKLAIIPDCCTLLSNLLVTAEMSRGNAPCVIYQVTSSPWGPYFPPWATVLLCYFSISLPSLTPPHNSGLYALLHLSLLTSNGHSFSKLFQYFICSSMLNLYLHRLPCTPAYFTH